MEHPVSSWAQMVAKDGKGSNDVEQQNLTRVSYQLLIPRMRVHLNLQWDGMVTTQLWASNCTHMEYLYECCTPFCDVKQKGAAGSSRAQGYDQTWHLIFDAIDIQTWIDGF